MATQEKPSNVINLMDALRQSVKAERGGSPRSSARRGHGAPRRKSPAKRSGARARKAG